MQEPVWTFLRLCNNNFARRVRQAQTLSKGNPVYPLTIKGTRRVATMRVIATLQASEQDRRKLTTGKLTLAPFGSEQPPVAPSAPAAPVAPSAPLRQWCRACRLPIGALRASIAVSSGVARSASRAARTPSHRPLPKLPGLRRALACRIRHSELKTTPRRILMVSSLTISSCQRGAIRHPNSKRDDFLRSWVELGLLQPKTLTATGSGL